MQCHRPGNAARTMPQRIVNANGAGQDSSGTHGARGNVGGVHQDVAAHGHIGSHAALHGEDSRGALPSTATSHRAAITPDETAAALSVRQSNEPAGFAGLTRAQRLLFEPRVVHGIRLPPTFGDPGSHPMLSNRPVNSQWRRSSPPLTCALAVADNPGLACNGRW